MLSFPFVVCIFTLIHFSWNLTLGQNPLTETGENDYCFRESHKKHYDIKSCECSLIKNELNVFCKVYFMPRKDDAILSVSTTIFELQAVLKAVVNPLNVLKDHCLSVDSVRIASKQLGDPSIDLEKHTVGTWHNTVQEALFFIKYVELDLEFRKRNQRITGVAKYLNSTASVKIPQDGTCLWNIQAIDFTSDIPLHRGDTSSASRAVERHLQRWAPYLKDLRNSKIIIQTIPNLRHVPRQFFEMFSEVDLRWVIFKEMRWTAIKEDAFPVTPNVTTVEFIDNTLNYMHPRCLKGQQNLNMLNLTGNQFSSIPEAALRVPSLRILDMTRNKPKRHFLIKPVESISSNITSLNLTHTPVIYLHSSSFKNFPQLRILNLKNCTLQNISDYAFEGLNELKILILSENNINALTNHTFEGLDSLEVLDLHHSGIIFLENSQPFSMFSKIINLDLTENSISDLYDENFKIPELSMLNLSNNLINSWTSNVFADLPNNSIVDLQNNSIRALTPDMIKGIQGVQRIQIYNNPFDCESCSLPDFIFWINNRTNESLEAQRYICSSPESFKNIPLILAFEQFNEQLCELKTFNVISYIVVPFTCTLFILSLLIFLSLKYKWYLKYLYYSCRIKALKYKNVKTCDKYQYDAFVSYSEEDSSWVKQELIPRLENQDAAFKLCIHERDFILGWPIEDNIVYCIEHSRKTVFVLSESFLNSRWCMLELNLASHKMVEASMDSLVIIKIATLPDELITKPLKYIIDTRTYLEYPSNPGEISLFWLRVQKALYKPILNLDFTPD